MSKKICVNYCFFSENGIPVESTNPKEENVQNVEDHGDFDNSVEIAETVSQTVPYDMCSDNNKIEENSSEIIKSLYMEEIDVTELRCHEKNDLINRECVESQNRKATIICKESNQHNVSYSEELDRDVCFQEIANSLTSTNISNDTSCRNSTEVLSDRMTTPSIDVLQNFVTKLVEELSQETDDFNLPLKGTTIKTIVTNAVEGCR